MKRKAIILFLLLSYLTVSSFAQQKKVDVTYVGNSGFLLNIGDKKILIDALFKGFEGNYELPQDIQDKLTSAQAPFDDVDLILVTHAHGDHINPDMVRKHLQNNPKAIFASTQQLVDALHDSTDRCIGFNPTKEKSESKVINGISIEAFYFPHGSDSRIINIGFLISVNEITIFQTGDVDFDQFTFEEFRLLQLPERKIDLAFIQHFYLTSDSISKQFVTKGIGGKYIIPIHYHFTTPSFDKAIVKANYPDAILFDKELESWEMPLKEIKFSNLKGDYLGQTPPWDVPVIFAPGIISVDSTVEHGYPTFSPDGNMIFWQSNLRHKEKETEIFLKVMRRVDGRWTEPEISPYGGMPTFSPDGNKLFFYSRNRPGGLGYIDAWYVERTDNGWSKPINAGQPFNTDGDDRPPIITEKGNAYTMGRNLAEDKVNYLKFNYTDGKFSLPTTVSIYENSPYWWPLYVSPDETHIIFPSAMKDSFGGLDLYICFKDENDIWEKPINLGPEINTKTSERFPIVSPDGKYLFFMRHTETWDIFWVSTDIIKNLKTK